MALDQLLDVVKVLGGAMGGIGFKSLFFEPWRSDILLRRKYAARLWVATEELRVHMKQVARDIQNPFSDQYDALLKIPVNDFQGRPDWFVKRGYYTMITAYKIAVVAAWLQIYLEALFFSPYWGTKSFLMDLYGKSHKVKLAFSTGTCLWYDYFEGIGDKIVVRGPNSLRPLSFAEFCKNYYTDDQFRGFMDQTHMFIHLMARKHQGDTQQMMFALKEVSKFLEKKGMISEEALKQIGIESKPDIDTNKAKIP